MILRIKHLHVTMSLGMLEWERKAPRSVVLTITAQYNAAQAMQTDDIRHTLDYAALEHAIISIAQKRHYNLIEHLIAEIGREGMAAFPMLEELTIEADKPGALRQAQSVSIAETFRRV